MRKFLRLVSSNIFAASIVMGAIAIVATATSSVALATDAGSGDCGPVTFDPNVPPADQFSCANPQNCPPGKQCNSEVTTDPVTGVKTVSCPCKTQSVPT